MNITFRLWTTDDAQTIHDILRETWLATYGSFIPRDDLLGFLDQHHSPQAIKDSLANPNLTGYLAFVDGVAAGCERIHFRAEESRLYVQQLYILPKYQGFGLGKKLMQLAAEIARSHHLDCIWLGVMVRNDQALKWYQRYGYTIATTEPFMMGNTSVEHYIGYVPLERLEE